MKTLNVNSNLLMTSEEIANYNSLPDNMPTNKLTKKQIDIVNELYYKYIGKTIDNKDWSLPMYKEEQKEKWPSGPRMKEHEAKRIILNNLVDLQEKVNYNDNEKMSLFFGALTCRPMYSKLIANLFEYKY